MSINMRCKIFTNQKKTYFDCMTHFENRRKKEYNH